MNKAKEKIPRCPAKWKVGGDDTAVQRPCNKYATDEVDVYGMPRKYCPEHAADRRATIAQTTAKEKAEAAKAERRRRRADELISRVPVEVTGWEVDLPKGATLVFAIECGCGKTFARFAFPDHYARCSS